MTKNPQPRPHHPIRAVGAALLALAACAKAEAPKPADSASVQATAAPAPAAPTAGAPTFREGAVYLFARPTLTGREE